MGGGERRAKCESQSSEELFWVVAMSPYYRGRLGHRTLRLWLCPSWPGGSCKRTHQSSQAVRFVRQHLQRRISRTWTKIKPMAISQSCACSSPLFSFLWSLLFWVSLVLSDITNDSVPYVYVCTFVY